MARKFRKLSTISKMDKISASDAKQSFGRLLEMAASAPVGIERHGKLVAAMVPPQWLSRSDLLDERRVAREQQKQVDQSRLMAHQRVAIELLSHPEMADQLLSAARAQVQRWATQNLCSDDYIDRWHQWLALPQAELAQLMCSDANGWGKAMRQNSPFAGMHR